MILHDWPDHDCARILQALIPVLKPGARVILIEYIGALEENDGPVPPRSATKMGTATDLRLMALFNGKERPVEQWRGVFKGADERFEVENVKANPGNIFAVIEAVWRG